MPRRLKVYAAEIDGLNEWIVAAPNRKAALAAFGVNQDLFAQGLAREEDDAAAAAQAQACPETPLRRPKGSGALFSPASTGSEDAWAAAAKALPKARAPSKARKPDRRALDRAEAALQALVERHEGVLAEIQAERDRLEQRAAAERASFAKAEARARAAVEAAGRAWREAGGG